MRSISSFSLFALFAFASCSQSSMTGGSSKQPAAESKKPAPPQVPQPYTPTPTPPCTNQGVTSTQLTQNSIRNNTVNQKLTYVLTVLNCIGQTQDLVGNQILFDVNGVVTLAQIDQPLSYRILKQDGIVLAIGQMIAVQGSDLFGNVSTERRHHKTSASLNIPAGTKQILLELDLSNREFHAPTSSSPPPASEPIDTFLKFGNATPATQKVTFINN